jgi:hypothetical protein
MTSSPATSLATGPSARNLKSSRRFPLDTLLTRDKVNLDIFWVKDHALDDPDLLPPPDEVAAEIVESLETALDSFRNVAKALGLYDRHKLFRISIGTVNELTGTTDTIEKSVQTLFEKNLEPLLGVRFTAAALQSQLTVSNIEKL